MKRKLTRRGFLKAGGGALAGAYVLVSPDAAGVASREALRRAWNSGVSTRNVSTSPRTRRSSRSSRTSTPTSRSISASSRSLDARQAAGGAGQRPGRPGHRRGRDRPLLPVPQGRPRAVRPADRAHRRRDRQHLQAGGERPVELGRRNLRTRQRAQRRGPHLPPGPPGRLGVETPFETWDQVIEAGKQIAADGETKTFAVHDIHSGDWFQMAQAAGTSLFDAEGNYQGDNPLSVEAMQFLHDLVYVHR